MELKDLGAHTTVGRSLLASFRRRESKKNYAAYEIPCGAGLLSRPPRLNRGGGGAILRGRNFLLKGEDRRAPLRPNLMRPLPHAVPVPARGRARRRKRKH